MSLNTSSRFVLKVLEDLDTALSLSLAIRLRYNDLAGILAVKLNPVDYVDAQHLFRDSQALALFQKRTDLVVQGVDRRATALAKWWDAERACYKSNERLARFSDPLSLAPDEEVILRFFHKVRKTLRSWIGHAPPSLDSINRWARFGPGSTYQDRGRLTTVPDKMSSIPTLTPSAHWYLLPFLETKWGRVNHERGRGLDQVRGNRYLTVPKNALTDRSIAVEPSINVFYQLGLGQALRSRLQKTTGWDLDHAQDIHREMARRSSIDSSYATIDLSSASDTVCYELVRLVTPPAWFAELNALRSPFTRVDGRWVRLEKFSSMGNGFTFELETLVFSAILSTLLAEEGALGLLGVDMFVFGDDIILPRDHVRSAIAVLRFCGFQTNESKTFVSGEFRESCGADYFHGEDVRPYFLKEPIYEPEELIPCLNGIRRAYKKLQHPTIPVPYGGWHILMDCLPSWIKSLRGPERLGDCVIHDEEPNWNFKWRHGIRYFRGIKRCPGVVAWHHFTPEVVLASALYGVGDGLRGVTPRDSPFVNKVAWVPCS